MAHKISLVLIDSTSAHLSRQQRRFIVPPASPNCSSDAIEEPHDTSKHGLSHTG
jgi:hypothetical protein